ncbi:MAG: glycyl-radical enzyme activating protein [Elusimicrobiota bacterium]
MISSAGQNREAVVFDIQRFSIHDGPGIRTTVFFKGCPLHCWWCHNPESWSSQPDLFFNKAECISCHHCIKSCKTGAVTQKGFDRAKCLTCGDCTAGCPVSAREIVGTKVSLPRLMKEVLKDKVFYDYSSGGVTVSGGEPLNQSGFVTNFFMECKKNRISTALQTCGYGSKNGLLSVLKYTDIVMLDIKHIDDKKHREATGVSNRLILENAELISKTGIPMVIRIPVIPGFNSTRNEIVGITKFVTRLKMVNKILLLKYHNLGMYKWNFLGKKPPVFPAGISNTEFKRLCSVSKAISFDDNISLI